MKCGQLVTIDTLQMKMMGSAISLVAVSPSNRALHANETFQSLPLEIRFAVFDLYFKPPGQSEVKLIDLTILPLEPNYWSLFATCKQFRNEISTWLKAKPHLVKSYHFGLINPGNTLFTITIDQAYRQQKNDFIFGRYEDLKRGSESLPWGKWAWTRLWKDFKHIHHLDLKLDSPDLITGSTGQPNLQLFLDWYRRVKPEKGSHDNCWAIYSIATRLHTLKTLHIFVPWDQEAKRTGFIFPFARFRCGTIASVEFKILNDGSEPLSLVISKG